MPRAGAAEEGPHGGGCAVAIGVAGSIAAFVAIDFVFGGSHGAPIGAYTTNDTYSYVSAPALHPPVIKARHQTAASKLAPGYILMTNFYDLSHPPMIGQSGPLILDNNLQPVWFKPVPTNVVAGNLSLQTYQGKPALAWWQGVVTNTGATEQRRVRRRQPALPDGGDAARHRRLGAHAARARDPRRRRVGHRRTRTCR